jgi:hypothetical protein
MADQTDENPSAGDEAAAPRSEGDDRSQGEDPRATSHPTGEAQAAENAENESPS